jgi:hypothetical protein
MGGWVISADRCNGAEPVLFTNKFNPTWNFAPLKIAVTQNCYEFLKRHYEGRGTTNPWFFFTPRLELKG